MNTLLYDFNNCHVRKGEQTLSAGIKPVFSFEYQALSYDGITGGFRNENVDTELTTEQIQEIEDYIAAITADPIEQTNMDSQMYLAETDWYVVRKFETGTAIPQEVLIKRQEAREAITVIA
jgi:hypothetical protein